MGRIVTTEINGQPAIPFQGLEKHSPTGYKFEPQNATCTNYPSNIESLKTEIEKAGLKEGMTISTHHHFRNGDSPY